MSLQPDRAFRTFLTEFIGLARSEESGESREFVVKFGRG